jgi:pentatricopeptide repeat protein
VLKGFSHQKKYESVWKVHREMVEEKLQFSITTYNTLIDVCARSGNMGCVEGFLEEMSTLKIEPNVITYSTILKGYCQENRLDKAFDLLQDMKKTAQFRPDEITYNTLLDGCARHGYYERGMALLEDMQAAKVAPSNFTLSVLVKLCNRGKRLEMAFELCSNLSKKYNLKLNVHVYNNLMHACTQHGDLPRALTVFQELLRERIRPDPRSYGVLVRGSLAACETQGAASILRAAAGLAHGHPQLAAFEASALRPSEALPAELLAEVLEDLAKRDNGLTMRLLQDLRSVPGIRLDQRLSARLIAKGGPAPQTMNRDRDVAAIKGLAAMNLDSPLRPGGKL